VVVGCGMIGMGAVAGAAARGAEIIAVDLGEKSAADGRKLLGDEVEHQYDD
jgi:threonine dehydrogenase-like Zn-dependent dehydrogenase